MVEALREEGGALVQPLSDAFFEHLEGHHVEEGMRAEALVAAAKELDGDGRGLIAVDYAGRNLLGAAADPDLLRLAVGDDFAAAMARFRRDGVREFVIDNYDAVLGGTAEYAARAQFRVFDAAKVVLGHGRVQTGARARLHTYDAQVRRGVLLYGGLAAAAVFTGLVVSGLATWWLLRREVGRPLQRLVEQAGEAGEAVDRHGLAGAVAVVGRLRTRLEEARREAVLERAGRLQAEEDRDVLVASQRRISGEAEAAAEARAREVLIASERMLLRRMAGALRSRIEPLLRQPDALGSVLSGMEREAAVILAEISGECGGLRPEMEEIELSEWLPGAMGRVGEGVEFRCGEGLRVRADVLMLGRVLVRLVERARGAVSEGGRVSVEAVGVDGGVEFRVVDHGRGMAGGARALAEEPLFSASEEGLGGELRFARCVAEAHGGTLRVHSEVGRGTAVVLALPVQN
jgi:signal transduction histidine kinase